MKRLSPTPGLVAVVLAVLLAALSACGVPARAPAAAPTAVLPTAAPAPPTPTATLPPATVAPALPAGVWQLVRIEYMSGKVVTIDKPENYTVQFLGEGRLSIKADCNGGAGTYEAKGAALAIARLATTKMACPPGSLDNQFVQGLSNAAAYVLDGGELTISMMYDGGEMVFARER